MFSQEPCGRGVVDLQLAGQALGPGRRKCLVERRRGVGVELIEHQHDPLRRGIVDIDQLLDAVGEVAPGPLDTDPDVAPPAQWFGDHEETDHPRRSYSGSCRAGWPGAAGSGSPVSATIGRLVSARHTTGGGGS